MGEERGCRKRSHAALAEGNNVYARSKAPYHGQHAGNVRIEAKGPLLGGNVPDVDPIGDINAEKRQQADHKVAEKKWEMAR